MTRKGAIEDDLRKFHTYLEAAYGIRTIASALMLQDGSKERVVVLGLDEMVSELSIITLAGLRGLTLTRR